MSLIGTEVGHADDLFTGLAKLERLCCEFARDLEIDELGATQPDSHIFCEFNRLGLGTTFRSRFVVKPLSSFLLFGWVFRSMSFPKHT